jgi:hypothetical protein
MLDFLCATDIVFFLRHAAAIEGRGSQDQLWTRCPSNFLQLIKLKCTMSSLDVADCIYTQVFVSQDLFSPLSATLLVIELSFQDASFVLFCYY